MHKLFFATALAAAIIVPDALYSAAAAADGFRRHHRWGDRDYEIVRWSYGDCKIWYDDGGPPWGRPPKDWVVLADGLRTYDAAWRALVRLRGLRKCS